MNSDTHKYYLNFPMSHFTVAASLTKLCIEFSSEDTVDLDMKGIGNRHIPSRDLSNSHFPPSFSCASDFLASSDTYFLQKHQSHSILGPVCLYVEPSRGVWS